MKTIFAFVTAALIALLAFVQIVAAQETQKAQISELNDLLSQRDENNELRDELERVKSELLYAVEESRLAISEIGELRQKLETAEILAGITDVRGPGITVTVSDGKAGGVIHDSDLLMIVNELRDAGAEALSVNGERILATSEIRCAGSIVSINNCRYSAPFEISAVGNVETMYNALYMTGGVLDVLGQWKMNAVVEKNYELSIPAFDGNVVFLYATAIGG